MLNKDSPAADAAPCEVNNDDDPQSSARSQNHNNNNNIIIIDDDDEIAPLSPSTFNVAPVDEEGDDYLPPFFSPLPSIVDSFGEYNMNTSPQYDVELNPPYQYLGWNDMDNLFTTIPFFQPPPPPPSSLVSSSFYNESNDEPFHQNSPKDETTPLHGDCVGKDIINSSEPNDDHFHHQDSSTNNNDEESSYDPPFHQDSSNPNLPPLVINDEEPKKNQLEPEVDSEIELPDRNNNIPLHLVRLVDYSGNDDDNEEESSEEAPFHQYSTLSSPSTLLPLVDYSDDEEDEESSDDDQSFHQQHSSRENITLSSLFPLVAYSSSDHEDQESSDDDDKPSYQNPSTKLSSPTIDAVSSSIVSALPTPSAIVVPSSSSSCASHPPQNNNKQAVISVKPSKYQKRKRNQSKEKKVNEGDEDDANIVVGFRKGVPTVSEMDLLQAFLHSGTNRDKLWPLIIRVNVKQDVVATLKLIAEENQLNLLIVGTVGTFSLIELLHEGKPATFEGNFSVISFSGSIFVRKKNGEKTETTTQLSVSVVGADGKVFGGPVHGRLIASSPMQTIGLAMVRKVAHKTRSPRVKITIPKLQMLIKSIKDRAKADKAKAENVPEASQKEAATNCGSDLYDVEVKMVDMIHGKLH